MKQTLSMTLAEYAASTTVDKNPTQIRERAKQVILDEMACAHFGRRSLGGGLAAKYAVSLGGAQESLILGTRSYASAPYAALANGSAGHGEEVDGAHVIGGHPGATLVHAAVALAEQQRVSGAELVNAVVLGYDVGIRVIEACGGLFAMKNRFGLNSDFLHALGCSAASSRLLGLDPLKHCHAMTLSSFGSNALVAFYAEKRHISKSLCNGMHASAGVTGALMAMVGLEGHEDILGAPFGVLHAWGSKEHQGALTRGLGETYKIMGANFKFVNAGYPIHAPVEAALTLVAKHGIKLDAIASIHIGMPTNAMRVVDGRDMHNICVQDMVTAALIQGGLKLRELPFPAMLGNPAFPRLRPRVTAAGDADLDRDQPTGRGAIVRMTLTDGATVSLRVEHPRGHSLRGGVTWDELAVKWQDGLPECDIDRMLALTRGLEDVEDVNELVTAFITQK